MLTDKSIKAVTKGLAPAECAQAWMQRIADADDGPYRVMPRDDRADSLIYAALALNPFLPKESVMKKQPFDFIVTRKPVTTQPQSSEEALTAAKDPGLVKDGRVWATDIRAAQNRIFHEMNDCGNFDTLEVLIRPFCS